MAQRDLTKELAIEWLKRDEGLRLHPYQCTADKTTIGYGRNIEDNGISESEAEYLLLNDYQVAKNDAKKFYGPELFNLLTPSQQAVLCCLAFNMGLPTLRKFVKFKAALHAGDIATAQQELLTSRYAHQVKSRAFRMAEALSQ